MGCIWQVGKWHLPLTVWEEWGKLLALLVGDSAADGQIFQLLILDILIQKLVEIIDGQGGDNLTKFIDTYVKPLQLIMGLGLAFLWYSFWHWLLC